MGKARKAKTARKVGSYAVWGYGLDLKLGKALPTVVEYERVRFTYGHSTKRGAQQSVKRLREQGVVGRLRIVPSAWKPKRLRIRKPSWAT